jgi:hypothetical protein
MDDRFDDGYPWGVDITPNLTLGIKINRLNSKMLVFITISSLILLTIISWLLL